MCSESHTETLACRCRVVSFLCSRFRRSHGQPSSVGRGSPRHPANAFFLPNAKGRPRWSGLLSIITTVCRHLALVIFSSRRKRHCHKASHRQQRISVVAYSVILDTTPAPTVRPPSRIAKRRPCSIAMGAISSTSNFRLSPGMTISVPSGRATVPVTSVVRK